ncbi:MAG: hypothetical protein LBU79_01380, partial [Planctomycetota bacterium]|nr:hypothetical protein [Planctomycetota bacterium]
MSEELAVIFDLGRVLLDLDWRGEKFSSLMTAMDITPSRAFADYWQEPEVNWHTTGVISSAEFHQAAIDRYNLQIRYEDFVEAWCDIFYPIAGMEEIFRRVAKSHPVGILSDTDPLHWA